MDTPTQPELKQGAPTAPPRRTRRRILAVLALLAALAALGTWMFVPRDQVLGEQAFPADDLQVRVVARHAGVGSARLYLEVQESRLGESQRIYLRSWERPLKDLGAPRIDRPGRASLRVAWGMGLSDEVGLALRSLQAEPPR